jgi:sorbitol-specific phosphotransferase system component IIBC
MEVAVIRILGLLVLVILLLISMVAFLSVFGLFFNRRVERTKENAQTGLWRSFLVGLINFIFFAAVALALFALGNRLGVKHIFGLLGLMVLLPLAIGLVFGLAGMVRLVGDKFAPESASELLRTVWGTLMLTLACGLPFVGWFGLLPFVGLVGLGALILSLFSRESKMVAAGEPGQAA